MDASDGHAEANGGSQPVMKTEDVTGANATTVPPGEEEEDATNQINLGPEFRPEDGAQPLFISEVAHLLKQKVESKDGRDISSEIDNPVLMKSLRYAERFGQLAKTEQAIAVRDQLQAIRPHLHPFEVAQIASLMPKDAEEAKAIIPSLADKYDDDVLNNILKDLDVWL